MKVNLGGGRIGSGQKVNVNLRTYERSTHDLGFVWRSTMAFGTLVPFMTEVGLPGDTMDIELDVDVNTHPTNGPMFGRAKIQLDLYQIPMRLYLPKLMNNKKDVGMNMNTILLPQVQMYANPIDFTQPIDNQQMNPSSIFSHLNIRGLGRNDGGVTAGRYVRREFNAITWLMYWDCVANYYANKQEGIAAVLHTEVTALPLTISFVTYFDGTSDQVLPQNGTIPVDITAIPNFLLDFQGAAPMPTPKQLVVKTGAGTYTLSDYFQNVNVSLTTISCTGPRTNISSVLYGWDYASNTNAITTAPTISTFPLTNIDQMRELIMDNVTLSTPFLINNISPAPYGLALQQVIAADNLKIQTSKMYSQEGLALKTYNSDLFQNWLRTTWIGTGSGSVAILSSVDTAAGSFTIDSLVMAQNIYKLLNRIAVSGGTYNDWIEAVYDHQAPAMVNSPMYIGGLIRELAFQEVVSNSASSSPTQTQPLGTLAGKGVLTQRRIGGNTVAKIHEPSYIIGIASVTPLIDYSQGNKWDTNLTSINQLHKPQMDQIGFQQLITDQFAWWETTNNGGGTTKTFRSVGYQPAWLNYMTNVNYTRGNFADPLNQMFMTFNRRYEIDTLTSNVKDMTTYIDPAKFNYIFAYQARDAQNLWMQIKVKNIARRKMSAEVMPNL